MGGDGLLRIGAAVCLFRILGELLPLLFTEELGALVLPGRFLSEGRLAAFISSPVTFSGDARPPDHG